MDHVINYAIDNQADNNDDDEEYCTYCYGEKSQTLSVSVFAESYNNDCSCLCESSPVSDGLCGDECGNC